MHAREQRSRARPRIVIAASEHNALVALAEKASATDSGVGDYLMGELARASVVPDGKAAATVVRMGSTVTYRDEATSRVRTVRLVYPKDADIDRNHISVLTPIGAALIGLATNQSMDWPSPAGAMESLTVLKVDNDS